jgi:hypothetical protein
MSLPGKILLAASVIFGAAALMVIGEIYVPFIYAYFAGDGAHGPTGGRGPLEK